MTAVEKLGLLVSEMFGVVPPDDAKFPPAVTLVTPVAPPAALIVRLGAAPVMEMFVPAVSPVSGNVTSAEFAMVPATIPSPRIAGDATSVMFGVVPPDEAILLEPVTLVTPAAGTVALIVRFGAVPVIETFAPAVKAVSGVVTSEAFGIVAAVIPAPLMSGAVKNVYAIVPPNVACPTVAGLICDA